jgi:hypothetical protein
MENRTTGSEFILLTAEAAEGVADKAGIRSKGILNSATAEIGTFVTVGGVRHSNRCPMLMNIEKGIRNFTATANHTQYRT